MVDGLGGTAPDDGVLAVPQTAQAQREVLQAVDERAQSRAVEFGGAVDGREPQPGRFTTRLLIMAEADLHGQQRCFKPGACSFRSRQPDRGADMAAGSLGMRVLRALCGTGALGGREGQDCCAGHDVSTGWEWLLVQHF